jgi:hypothetical protein
VVFASDAEHAASGNGDGSNEIFVWNEGGAPEFEQITSGVGCDSVAPSVDARGRFIAFETECDPVPAVGNPDRSVFVYDRARACYMPLSIRGPILDEGPPAVTASSEKPVVSKRVKVITYLGDADSADPKICFFNTKDIFRKLPPCQP